MDNCKRPELPTGSVEWFHHIHLDSIIPHIDSNHIKDSNDDYTYTVKGKPRPMVVLGLSAKAYRIRWYWVLKLTTQKCADPTEERHYLPVGRVVCDTQDSYLCLRPFVYPENLADNRRTGDKNTVAPWLLQAILREFAFLPGVLPRPAAKPIPEKAPARESNGRSS